jgi:small neutral amino acid transporter SnatA (MarC family)
MVEFVESGSLLLALLNPFLLIIYLVDLIKSLDQGQFRRVLIRAGLIAGIVFCCFAVLGDAIFSQILRAEFASFQIFGGLIFILIGIQFVFRGPASIEILRGESGYVAGAIAMPVLIGPGTISASVIIGKKHEPLIACAVVGAAVVVSLTIVVLLKALHDYVRPRREPLVERYIEIAGRVTALYVGTVAVDMIMQGIRTWLEKT